MIYQFLPIAIMFASMIIPVGVALWIRHQRRHRRTPLTVQLLRSPGESLGRQIEKLSEDIDTYFAFLVITPLLSFSVFLSARYLGNQKVNGLLFSIPCIAYLAFFAFKLIKLLKIRNNLLLGLDCERAVGQELDQLMLEGYRVYHDFPAENFNIDHIVIGSNGVFAVETKGRAKPVKGDVNIIFDGAGLKFPTHYESKPFEQAKRQAIWLSKWLTSAVGAQVEVRPVLVFPGWYIERKKPGMLIYNGKNPQAVYRAQSGQALSAEMVQRISHQIEQRCRDVDATAYKKMTLKELFSD
jgi:Nuclease-related domain